MSFLTTVRRLLFSVSSEEATFSRRGFRSADPNVQLHLELIGRQFLAGYNRALQCPDPEILIGQLDQIVPQYRGFAFEGAAMGLALLDRFNPWDRQRFERFLSGPARIHKYMLYVGAGWAAARVGWLRGSLASYIANFDPLLRWLVVDGYGFHQGYFHWPRYITRQAIPRELADYGRRAFDQGLGRSMWFVMGADVSRITSQIQSFSSSRQADLWSGVGLACAYAGGVNRDQLEEVCRASGAFRPQLAQGVAFAAKARQLAEIIVPHTEMACQAICEATVAEAATLTDRCLTDLSTEGSLPQYETWRLRIHEHFARQQVGANRC